MGTEAHAQVFNCDGGRSVGKQIQMVLGALNPFKMNFRFVKTCPQTSPDDISNLNLSQTFTEAVSLLGPT